VLVVFVSLAKMEKQEKNTKQTDNHDAEIVIASYWSIVELFEHKWLS